MKLAAETAKVFGETVRDGDLSCITDIADRMDGTADELIHAAQAIDVGRAKASYLKQKAPLSADRGLKV